MVLNVLVPILQSNFNLLPLSASILTSSHKELEHGILYLISVLSDLCLECTFSSNSLSIPFWYHFLQKDFPDHCPYNVHMLLTLINDNLLFTSVSLAKTYWHASLSFVLLVESIA
jgi:hypothetical protein